MSICLSCLSFLLSFCGPISAFHSVRPGVICVVRHHFCHSHGRFLAFYSDVKLGSICVVLHYFRFSFGRFLVIYSDVKIGSICDSYSLLSFSGPISSLSIWCQARINLYCSSSLLSFSGSIFSLFSDFKLRSVRVFFCHHVCLSLARFLAFQARI